LISRVHYYDKEPVDLDTGWLKFMPGTKVVNQKTYTVKLA